MTTFPTSNQETLLREHLGTKVYMGSHPALRPYLRHALRPQEFGDRVWPAALCAMAHVAVEPSDRVLEIGCGWGIVGIHVARTFGARVTCTDADPRLRPFVEAHAALNGVSVPFEVRSFGELADRPLDADVIVGSDICYSEEVVGELARLVDAAARGRVRRVVIADAARPDFGSLVQHCQARYDCALSTYEGERASTRVSLLEISLPAAAGPPATAR
ncbi:MAG: methyltransferase [Vicinamibacterales bacterium]